MAMARTLSTSRTLILAVTAGFAIANTFTLQPLLPEVLRSFAASSAEAGWLASAAPFGYTLGMVLLVPLGDRVDTGRLIIAQLLGLSGALAAAGLAPSLSILAMASIAVGLMATAAAQCAAFGGRESGAERGRVIGTISTGVAIGILMGRTLGGVIGQAFGWRVMEALTAVGALGTAFAVRSTVVACGPRPASLGYAGLLRSIPASLAGSRELRLSTVAGSAWFCMFSGLWPCLSLHLTAPPFGYGAAVAGSFGLVGVAGAVAAQAGGRASDRIGPRRVITASMACALMGLTVMALLASSLPGLGLGMLLVDVGCFAAQAANQTRVLGFGGAGRNAAYSAYMVCYYISGTVGALIGPLLYDVAGWQALIAAGGALSGVAILANLASPGRDGDRCLSPAAS